MSTRPVARSRRLSLSTALSISLPVTALLFFTAQPARPQDHEPDWVLHHGKIVTVDGNFSLAEAVAITADHFTAVGSNEAVLQLAGSRTKTLDLHGRTVIPGLMDNHLHNAGGGPGVDAPDGRASRNR